ncbi:MAG: hypothetical protein OXF98_09365, partial [Rhodospirillaceae bacterium]|nr:hypothetical protein [Rhodospirillaceae bacterium]
MFKQLVTAAAIATGAALILPPPAQAQNANRRVLFPTQTQFEASAEAQRLVEAARTLVGDDLQREYDNVCTHTGPQRVALARQQAGLPPLENYVVEP